MKEAWANCNEITLFPIKHACIALGIFSSKKFKNIDWWSTDVTLVSMAANSATACNYIQIV